MFNRLAKTTLIFSILFFYFVPLFSLGVNYVDVVQATGEPVRVIFNDEVLLNLDPDITGSVEMHRAIIAFIDDAQLTLDIALYGANDPLIFDAIERCMTDPSRPCAVRIAAECDYAEDPSHHYYPTYNRLRGLGATVVSDCPFSGLQHSKYIIRDAGTANEGLFTGTANMTTTGIGLNANGAGFFQASADFPDIRILIDSFLDDHNQMMSGNFSTSKVSNGVETVRLPDGATMRVYHMPQDASVYLADMTTILCHDENYSMMLAVFFFTHNDMADCMRESFLEGTSYGVMDSTGYFGTGSDLPDFCSAFPLNAFYGKGEMSPGKAHMKLVGSTVAEFTIDGITYNDFMVLQSCNFSFSCVSRNTENVLLFMGETHHITTYHNSFWRMYNLYPDYALCSHQSAEGNIGACEDPDRRDEDYDGYRNEDDFDCREATRVRCADGVDNDRDGLVDLDDPNCWLLTVLPEPKPYKIGEIYYRYAPTPQYEFHPDNIELTEYFDQIDQVPAVMLYWSPEYETVNIKNGVVVPAGKGYEYQAPVVQEVLIYYFDEQEDDWIQLAETYRSAFLIEYMDEFGDDDVLITVVANNLEQVTTTSIPVCTFFNNCDGDQVEK